VLFIENVEIQKLGIVLKKARKIPATIVVAGISTS